MNKIYAVISTALFAMTVNASNFSPIGHKVQGLRTLDSGIVEVKPQAQIMEEAKSACLNARKSILANPIKPLSRADEEEIATFNPVDYNTWIFFDEDFNMSDDEGNSLPAPRGLLCCVESNLEYVGDSIRVGNFCGFSDYEFYITQNEQGYPVVKMGQRLKSEPVKYTMPNGVTKIGYPILGAMNIVTDPDNPNKEKLDLNLDGDLDMVVFQDEIDVMYFNTEFLAVFFQNIDNPNDIALNYYSALNRLCKPNATLAYDWVYVENGQEYNERVNKHVYCRFTEKGYQDPNTGEGLDAYFVSNVTPYPIGICPIFANFEDPLSETGYIWLADQQMAFPTQPTGKIDPDTGLPEYTGNFYMNTVYANGGNTDDLAILNTPQVFMKEGIYKDAKEKEYKALIWPSEYPGIVENVVSWGLSSMTTDNVMVYFMNTALVFDFVGDLETGESAGIQDVINDEVATGDPEYYTIQGVKVANPVPGQIYIVKEGSKVSKRIIR